MIEVLDVGTVSMLLKPDFVEGKLFWRERTPDMFSNGKFSADRSCKMWNNKLGGKEAFTANRPDGYKCGRIFSRNYRAHRVIWLLYTGAWPEEELDHINGNRADNRIANLRAVSASENRRNMRLSRANTSGFTGVFWIKSRRKWVASIVINRRHNCLGYFDDIAEAAAARKVAEANAGFHPNHGSPMT